MIKNLTDYGAFIDLGGIDGLLHVTDMSWGRVNHPSELFQVGDEIKVKVLKFDAESERVSLGLKQLQPDPWIDASMRYPLATPRPGARRLARGLRRLRRARARHRGPDPRLRDVVDQADQAPLEGALGGRHRRGDRARRRRARAQDLARHEADRAQPVERDRADLSRRHARERDDPQHHQLRDLRRTRRGDRRPRARLGRLVDGADQAPGREVQEGRRRRGGRAQDRQGEREVLARHQAARSRTRGTRS